MKKTTRCFTWLMLCGAMLSGTGCTAVQVRDRTYLQGLELQKSDEITVQLHDFESTAAIAQGSGDSMEQALAQAGAVTGKALFLGHTELIAYTDPSYSAYLSDWMTQYRLSPSCQILVMTEGETLEQQDTAQIVERLQYAQENGIVPKTNLFTILKEFAGASATALVPFYSGGGLSAALITVDAFCDSLSADAVRGLCWLRDDADPKTVTAADGACFQIKTASTQLYAQTQENGHVKVTVSIHITGEGDFAQAAQVIQMQCEAAITETVTQHHADVFGLEACLRSQCYHTIVDHGWDKTISNAEFQVLVVEGYS